MVECGRALVESVSVRIAAGCRKPPPLHASVASYRRLQRRPMARGARRPDHRATVPQAACTAEERDMASDADWVEDVRRWCFVARRQRDDATVPLPEDESVALGYEAACPPLQAPAWPDAPGAVRVAGAAR